MDDCEEFNRIQLRYKRANQVTELLNTDNEEVSKKLVERKRFYHVHTTLVKYQGLNMVNIDLNLLRNVLLYDRNRY